MQILVGDLRTDIEPVPCCTSENMKPANAGSMIQLQQQDNIGASSFPSMSCTQACCPLDQGVRIGHECFFRLRLNVPVSMLPRKTP